MDIAFKYAVDNGLRPPLDRRAMTGPNVTSGNLEFIEALVDKFPEYFIVARYEKVGWFHELTWTIYDRKTGQRCSGRMDTSCCLPRYVLEEKKFDRMSYLFEEIPKYFWGLKLNWDDVM